MIKEIRKHWNDYVLFLQEKYPVKDGEKWEFTCEHHKKIDELINKELDKEEILNTYKWIKVKRYQEEDSSNPDVNWKEAYQRLLNHHNSETNFLINFIRQFIDSDNEVEFLIDAPKNGFSHLVSSDIEKLHEFAQGLGVKRAWFENKRGKNQPHYDIKEEDFLKFVKAGAKVVDGRDIIVFLRKNFP